MREGGNVGVGVDVDVGVPACVWCVGVRKIDLKL